MTIVERLRKSDDFINFQQKTQEKIDKFKLTPQFKPSVTKGEKKKSETYEVGRLNDARDTKYQMILANLSNTEDLMFLSPSDLYKRANDIKLLALSESDPIDVGFSNKLQNLLDYKTLRSGNKKLLYRFYKKLGVKCCVYCNSQHVILLDDEQKTMRFQADHYIPKSKFPIFSITLANLVPVCNNCNHLKSTKELNYVLYYNDTEGEHHDLGFSLTHQSIVEYCMNRNSDNAENHLEIVFKDYYEKDANNSSRLNEVLKIDKIYEQHQDVVADLINKKIVYNESYLESLGKEFSKLFKREDESINHHLFNQMLYGHSLDEEHINKRVFSKLTIDVKKQLDTLDLKKYITGSDH